MSAGRGHMRLAADDLRCLHRQMRHHLTRDWQSNKLMESNSIEMLEVVHLIRLADLFHCGGGIERRVGHGVHLVEGKRGTEQSESNG